MTKQLTDINRFPTAPYRKVGTLTVLRDHPVHEMAQYPGADRILDIPPQTVDLECNGYYVRARFTGTVTARGYYGGETGVEETYWWSTYAYNADAFLGNPLDCHKDSNIVESMQKSWGDTYKITLD